MSDNYGKLLSAVENEELESIQDLLNQYGADSSEGYDSLCNSIIHKRTEMAKFLLFSGCRVNSNRTPSNTPLHLAVQNGDVDIIQLLLHHNADMDAINEDGLTPVLVGVSMDNEEIVDLLLSRGSTIKNYNVISPLHVAVEHGLYKMTEKLLHLGVYVNAPCKSIEELTPLHRASKIGNITIVKILLKNEANVDSRAMHGLTSMHFAAEKGYLEIINLLISKNADVNACAKNKLTPLYMAVQNSHREAAKCLMDHGAYINAEYKNLEKVVVENLLNDGFSVEPDDINNTVLLHTAATIGHIRIIKDLIDHGLDLVKNCTILHTVVKFKQIEIAKLLLSHGADVNAVDKVGKTAIYYSTENSDVTMTKHLLSHGASAKKNPEVLTIATRNVCKEIVEILLQSEIDIEATDEDGRTSLHLSADKYIGPSKCNDEFQIKTKGEIAKLLLSMGANVNAKTYKGRVTPLHIACDSGTKNVVQLLLEYKADVNCVVEGRLRGMYNTEDGDTAFYIAVRREDIDILEILLKNGADVCSKNSKGATPLHVASEGRSLETVSLLLEHGSPIDSTDMYGETPLFMPFYSDHVNDEILELLLKSGSDINISNNHNELAFVGMFDQSDFDSKEHFLEYIYDYEHGNIFTNLRLHLLTLKAANLYIREEFLIYMSTGDDSTKLHTKKCEDEIKDLKLEKIENCKLSLYDILTKNINSLANYARNEDIIRFFESNDYKKKFPIYAPMIERNFAKAAERCLLHERAQEFTICYLELPYQCSDYILRYLSNEDLKNIINASKTSLTLMDLS